MRFTSSTRRNGKLFILRRQINGIPLCPNCHRVFDEVLRPYLYRALSAFGATGLPKSWTASNNSQLPNSHWISVMSHWRSFKSTLDVIRPPHASAICEYHRLRVPQCPRTPPPHPDAGEPTRLLETIVSASSEEPSLGESQFLLFAFGQVRTPPSRGSDYLNCGIVASVAKRGVSTMGKLRSVSQTGCLLNNVYPSMARSAHDSVRH